MTSQQTTVWERLMKVFYTRDVAAVGVMFDALTRVDFHGKLVASIAICQYIPNVSGSGENDSIFTKMASSADAKPRILEPKAEMDGIYVWYANSTSRPERIESEFVPEIIDIINDCKVSRYYIDKHYRDMTFWVSGASMDRCWYSSLGELEKYDQDFKAEVSDQMNIPDDIPAHIYFTPKVHVLMDIMEGCCDSTGKADAQTVQVLLRRRTKLNDDEAWSVFDYAMKLGLFVEVENVYAKPTGKRPHKMPDKYDPT